jgi:RNA polymerase sigma-70 factor, ECF subfamily
MTEREDVTALLRAWQQGDQNALAKLMPLVYAELHRVAHRAMRRQQAQVTMQTTALVNEAYLRLHGAGQTDWRDRAHFFAFSAQVMRRILIDAARARATAKRGAGQRADHAEAIDLDAMPHIDSAKGQELIALDDSLNALAEIDPRKARVIEMRFFGGMSVEETAEVLKISPKSVLRDWKLAKAWLQKEMAKRP